MLHSSLESVEGATPFLWSDAMMQLLHVVARDREVGVGPSSRPLFFVMTTHPEASVFVRAHFAVCWRLL
jgi:hypothetical protein